MTTRPIDLLLSKLNGVKPAGEGKWVALCPAHDDHSQSLSIRVGHDGRALVRCFTGCAFKEIVAAAGLQPGDMFPESDRERRPLGPPIRPVRLVTPEKPSTNGASHGADAKRHWPVVASYDYVDADGELVFQVLRKQPGDGSGRKDFRQRQKGAGGWIYTLDGIEHRPLYRLPELLDDLAADRTILFVEGEKDCDTVRALGLPGCAHACGANGFRDEYAAQLAGARVVILPDNDDPGRAWAAQVGASLVEHGCMVTMLALPITTPKADVTDWVQAGGTAAELTRLLERATPWTTGDPVPLPPAPSRFVLYSVADLEALPPMEWLAGEDRAGILPAESLTAIFGAPAAGKSFVAADLACTIACRRPELCPDWMGNTVRRGPVLYVVAEGGRGFRHRVVAWRTRYHVPADELALAFVLEPVNLYGSEDITHILRAVDAMPAPPLFVVFDTVARCMVGGDENSAEDMGVVIERADRVKRETGATVTLVHHPRKDSDVERGSGALRAGVDTLGLVWQDEDGSRVLSCVKQKDAEEFAAMSFWLSPVGDSCVVSMQPPTGPRALTANQRAALKTLAETFPKGATATEWVRASTVAERSFYRVRAWLGSQGYVSETENGNTTRYRVTPSGQWALNGVVT